MYYINNLKCQDKERENMIYKKFLSENFIEKLFSQFYHEELISKLEPFYRRISIHMNLGDFTKLIKFKEQMTFFKHTQIQQILEQICQTLNLDVINEFLNTCMTNFRTLDESWICFLTIMITKHISLSDKSFKSIILYKNKVIEQVISVHLYLMEYSRISIKRI